MSFKIYVPNKIKILDEIINDVENNVVEEFLFWSPIEHYFPGDGNFHDNGESFRKLLSLISHKNINFFALFGSPSEQNFYDRDRNNGIKILGWPTSLLHYTNRYLKNIETSHDFEKLFLCLNRRSHTHRGKLVDSIFKNDLFQFGKISWKQVDTILNNHSFEFWKEIKMEIDGHYEDFFFDSKCFLNLVSESTSERLFFSEKTFKPILAEQTFLCHGFTNQNLYLKRYGFELYDEIFDYDFDSDPSIDCRVDGIIKNLNNLKFRAIQELYDITKGKISHNKRNAISILRNDFYISSELRGLFFKYKESFFEYQSKNRDMMMDILIDLLSK